MDNEITLPFFIIDKIAYYTFIEERNSRCDSEGNNALMWCCINAYSHFASKLIETGESYVGYVHPENKNTSLIYACQNKLEKVALELIETGISKPKHVNKEGKTALYYAIEKNLTKVIPKLQEITNN